MLKNDIISFYQKIRYLPTSRYRWLALIAAFSVLLILCTVMLSGDKQVFNKTLTDIISLADNIHAHYKIRPDYWGVSTQSAIDNKLVPARLLRGDKIVSSMGKNIIIGQDIEGNMVMPGSRQFMISISNISKSACLGLLTLPLTQQQNLSLTSVSVTSEDLTTDFTWGGDLSLPILEGTAKKYCKNHNTVSWIFE